MALQEIDELLAKVAPSLEKDTHQQVDDNDSDDESIEGDAELTHSAFPIYSRNIPSFWRNVYYRLDRFELLHLFNRSLQQSMLYPLVCMNLSKFMHILTRLMLSIKFFDLVSLNHLKFNAFYRAILKHYTTHIIKISFVFLFILFDNFDIFEWIGNYFRKWLYQCHVLL